MIKLRCVVICFLILFSCSNKKQSDLELFYEDYVHNINENKLQEFKSAKINSSGDVLNILEKEINDMYSQIIKTDNINNFIDSILNKNIQIRKYEEDKKLFIGLAFHYYLNDEEIGSKKFTTQMIEILNYKSNFRDSINEIKNEEIATNNFSNISKSDSFNLIFPVEIKNGKKYTYFTEGYPYSLKYHSADDSVTMKVFLLDKYLGNYSDGTIDKNSLMFKVKVIQLSDTNVFDFVLASKNKFNIGGQFEFCVNDYGRIIKIE
jgi:hypothetical protein